MAKRSRRGTEALVTRSSGCPERHQACRSCIRPVWQTDGQDSGQDQALARDRDPHSAHMPPAWHPSRDHRPRPSIHHCTASRGATERSPPAISVRSREGRSPRNSANRPATRQRLDAGPDNAFTSKNKIPQHSLHQVCHSLPAILRSERTPGRSDRAEVGAYRSALAPRPTGRKRIKWSGTVTPKALPEELSQFQPPALHRRCQFPRTEQAIAPCLGSKSRSLEQSDAAP